MEILRIIADGLITFVTLACTLLYWLVIIRIALSWLGVNPWTNGNQLVAIIFQAADTILAPFQKLTFLRIGPIDLSPLLAVVILNLIPRLTAALVYGLLNAVR